MLNNQYIKYNRFNLKGKNTDTDPDSWRSSLSVLRYLLRYMTINLASLMPFFTEYLYQELNMNNDICSVHLYKFKNMNQLILNEKTNIIADEMIHVIRVIKQVCLLRSKNGINMKSPLEKILVRCSPDVLIIINKYSNFILDELIVLDLEVNTFSWSNIQIELKPKFQIIKESYPTNIELLVKLINKINIDNEDNNKLRYMVAQNQTILLEEFSITPDMLNIIIKPNPIINYISEYQFIEGNNYIVYLNSEISPRIDQLTYGRVVATRFQRLRKYAGVHPWDKISLGYHGLTKFDIDVEPIAYTIFSICNIVPVKLTLEQINEIKPIYKGTLYPCDTDQFISKYNLDLYIF
jgi:isoleucyl-tRNA synthetase